MAKTFGYTWQKAKFAARADGSIETIYSGRPLPGVRAVLWSTGEAWETATAYLAEKARELDASGGSLDTMVGHAGSLRAYAEFLEGEGLDWWDFPDDRSARPTYRFRGHLMRKIQNKKIARSTASRHVSVVKAFYAWCGWHAVIADSAEPYRVRLVPLRYTNRFGQEVLTSVLSSDLAIRTTRAGHSRLEDGLQPIKLAQRTALLRIANKHYPREFQLMLYLGFFTGMRFGTIAGLTYAALRNHFPSRDLPGWMSIEVGGSTGIPTKFGVHYYPSIPASLLQELLDYCKRPERAIRCKKADDGDMDLVFLTRRGRRYVNHSKTAWMRQLRTDLVAASVGCEKFKFHWSRATFGTALTLMLLNANVPQNDIVSKLMATMGHANAASSMGYVKFIENEHEMRKAAQDYAQFLMPDLRS